MSDPAWLEALKEAYLADQASVFLLHGGGPDLDDELVAFLSRTREVVGLLAPPAALRFPGIGDHGHFDRILAAAFLAEGRHVPLREDVPEQALAKLWIAMGDPTTPQGYVVTGVDKLWPRQRKAPPPLAAGTPPIWEWPTHPRLRQSNHVLVLVAKRLDEVNEDLANAAFAIRVGGRGPVTSSPATVTEPLEALEPAGTDATVDAAPADPTPAPKAKKAAEPVPDELIAALSKAVAESLARHDETTRPSRLPVMAAVAELVGGRTGSPGALTWSLGEDGKPVASGDGGDDFVARWRADIALDAAAGMLIAKLGSGPVDGLDATAIRALAKRVMRLLPAS